MPPVGGRPAWIQILLWVCGFMCVEVVIVVWLSARRHAAKLHHPVIQRACIRIMLIGPVYSCFMWIALKWTSYDYLCAIPIGIYEGYAMLSFFEILVVYMGGEHKATLALASQSRGGQHTCNFYYTCELCCTTPNLGKRSTGFCTCMRLGSPRELYKFLKLSVAQFCVAKPLVSVMMALWYYWKDQLGWASSSVHLLRVINIIILTWAAQALIQMYSAVLPRLRGLGGEKVFLLLNMMVGIIIIQEFVTSALVLEAVLKEWSDNKTFNLDATDLVSIRVIAGVTIFEFTIFSNIFYRYFLPDVFEGAPSLLWYAGREKRMHVRNFMAEVFTFHHIFDEHRAWRMLESQYGTTASRGAAGVAEEKASDAHKRNDGAAAEEDLDTDETTRLL